MKSSFVSINYKRVYVLRIHALVMMYAQLTSVIPSLLTGAGAYAGCIYWWEYSKALTKMVYLNHHSFLPVIHALRTQNEGSSTIKPPPHKHTQYIDRANARYSVATSTAEKKELSRETSCKGPYPLPFHDCYQNTPVEPMHLLKNIAEHIVKLVLGIDSVMVRFEEKI